MALEYEELTSRAASWRQRMEYLGFLIIAAIAAALPLQIASALSGWSWRMAAPHLRRQKRALSNLALAFPDMSLAERERVSLRRSAGPRQIRPPVRLAR